MRNPIETATRVAAVARSAIVAIIVLQAVTIAALAGTTLYLDQRLTQLEHQVTGVGVRAAEATAMAREAREEAREAACGTRMIGVGQGTEVCEH